MGGVKSLAELSQKNVHEQDIWTTGIYRIAASLFASTRLEITIAKLLNTLSSLLPMSDCGIVVPAAEGEPEIKATSGVRRGSSSTNDPILPKAAIERIIATEARLVIPDASKSELFPAERWTSSGNVPGTFIGVPMKADQRTLGVLWIERAKNIVPNDDYEEEVRFLAMIANLSGAAIRLYRSHSRDAQPFAGEQQTRENSSGKERQVVNPQHPANVDWIVGESPALKAVMEVATAAAETNTTVLLRGESGTGKECFAKLIHEYSTRRRKPFISVNCAALPEALLESELFGHEKGAFTGALSQRVGRFELADGGTLLLDEIGQISTVFQAKLLRVLQERELERVGGTKTLKVDVRLICATNKDLEAAVLNGEFRADLYYRINVVPIHLPPLRERKSDIPRLAEVFLQRFNKENNRDLAFAPLALDTLSHCDFPGNVRELDNCVRRTATLARSNTITSSSFACQNGQCHSSLLSKGVGYSACGRARELDPAMPFSAGQAAPLIDRERLVRTMVEAGWVQARAARILGLTARQVGYALRRHGIQVKKL
ncbi:nif-specific transcriptional activator NifA [Sinorhizobium medicae]|nr:nif-specific transcriptional activator NifA [Sinorhizobium medicae]